MPAEDVLYRGEGEEGEGEEGGGGEGRWLIHQKVEDH